MEDIVFVGITLAFFALCVAYVRGLDRIVGSADDVVAAPAGGVDADREVAA